MSRSRRNKLKEGIFEAQITSLSHDGRGIATANLSELNILPIFITLLHLYTI